MSGNNREKQIKRLFRNKIRNTFTVAGFKYWNTEGRHVKVGGRKVEIDFIFVYENFLFICEDTTTGIKNIKDHIRNKKEAFGQIDKNLSDFLDILFGYKDCALEKKEYSIKFLYFSYEELKFNNDEYNLFKPIIFVNNSTLSYFHKMSKCIKRSIKYEIFRFLNLQDNDFMATTEGDIKTIKATIISPKTSTGIKSGIKMVSFMMSAETLMRNSYVARKDSWENSMYLYQRLIHEAKIKNIRKFLLEKGEAFYNNIIVALPDNVSFKDGENKDINLDDIRKHEVCTMCIPNEYNSICIIDGQHRVYAHYEGMQNDNEEKKISKLRKELHLLVTGLVFPEDMPLMDKTKIQSEIFLDINSNAKPVPQDVLLHISMLKNPLSDIGLARSIIESLNEDQIFLNKFGLSSLDKGKIKTASIIKFALRHLVSIEQDKDKKTLYSFWNGNKEELVKMSDNSVREYKQFCVKNLSCYFSAVRDRFKDQWNNPESKILSVISINGFIMAYHKLINKNGIQEFEGYKKIFSKLNVDFSKENFPYTSSQYAKFSEFILESVV